MRHVESLSRDGAGLRRFLRVPHTIYRGDPLWVAPLGGEVRTVLSRENPFFEHAEAQLFVACRAGRDVGRIAAIIDHRHNELRGERTASFGFFEELALMAERAGEPIGFMLSLPDYNQALKPLNGRLWPLGWLRFRRGVRAIRSGRVMLLGVKREYRSRGIETLMLLRSFRWALERGFTNLELSRVLEDNRPMQRYLDVLGAWVYKRYRLYEQPVRSAG